MIRLLTLIVVALLVWMLLRRALNTMLGSDRAKEAPRAAATEAVVELLACAHCGVHVPADRALLVEDEAFCSPRCREARGERASG